MDLDTRFTLAAAPIGGALGSLVERLVTHLKTLTTLAAQEQYAFLRDKTVELIIYIVVAAVVTTAAILLFPINRQNRPQLIGTAIIFGMVWPSVLDRLLAIAGTSIPDQ
jgi:hypothetical protein